MLFRSEEEEEEEVWGPVSSSSSSSSDVEPPLIGSFGLLNDDLPFDRGPV